MTANKTLCVIMSISFLGCNSALNDLFIFNQDNDIDKKYDASTTKYKLKNYYVGNVGRCIICNGRDRSTICPYCNGTGLLIKLTEKPVESITSFPVAENGSFYGQISDTTGFPKTVFVKGYYRKDGTYVQSYYRSLPGNKAPPNRYLSVYPESYSNGTAENNSYYGQISEITGRPKTVHVRGYYRKDGTYVRGHYQSSPKR